MSAIIITSNAEQIERTLKEFPKEMDREMRKVFRAQGRKIQARLIRVSTRNLKRRTGSLARGWVKPQIIGKPSRGEGIAMILVNETKYAHIQEEGGEIKPTSHKFLAIPTQHAKTAAGVAKISPRDLPDKQTFVKEVNGTKFIFLKQSKNDKKPLAMFTLKEKVIIPPRLQATGAFFRQRYMLERAIDEAVAKIWSKKI